MGMPWLHPLVAPMRMAMSGAAVAHGDQSWNMKTVPRLDSGGATHGMVMANPAAAQFDRQQNPLIETRAN
jgi:hypothetical protein